MKRERSSERDWEVIAAPAPDFETGEVGLPELDRKRCCPARIASASIGARHYP